VEEYARLGAELLPGWAINEVGQPAKDPEAVLRSGALMNLGGSREQSGHKGYCLAAMVDILCSVNIKNETPPTPARFARLE
jgi:LDH2 family malate/lactate/ureidoglycolate dehydrogenase